MGKIIWSVLIFKFTPLYGDGRFARANQGSSTILEVLKYPRLKIGDEIASRRSLAIHKRKGRTFLPK